MGKTVGQKSGATVPLNGQLKKLSKAGGLSPHLDLPENYF
jgi:hypothetical protein